MFGMFFFVSHKTTAPKGNFHPVLETLRLTLVRVTDGLTSKQIILYHLRNNQSERQVIFVTFGSSFHASSPVVFSPRVRF